MKIYKYEITETIRYFVEVEANTGTEAEEKVNEKLNEAFSMNKVEGVKYQKLDTDVSMVGAEEIEEEPADEDLVREGFLEEDVDRE